MRSLTLQNSPLAGIIVPAARIAVGLTLAAAGVRHLVMWWQSVPALDGATTNASHVLTASLLLLAGVVVLRIGVGRPSVLQRIRRSRIERAPHADVHVLAARQPRAVRTGTRHAALAA